LLLESKSILRALKVLQLEKMPKKQEKFLYLAFAWFLGPFCL